MPKYDLQGINGNAFCVLGYTTRAMRREHYSTDEIRNFEGRATSRDYDYLLSLCMEKIDEINARVGINSIC